MLQDLRESQVDYWVRGVHPLAFTSSAYAARWMPSVPAHPDMHLGGNVIPDSATYHRVEATRQKG